MAWMMIELSVCMHYRQNYSLQKLVDDDTAVKLAVPVSNTGVICFIGVHGNISVFEK